MEPQTEVKDVNILLRHASGEPALWIARTADGDTLNDTNTSVPVAPDEDIDALVAEWKWAVGWGE